MINQSRRIALALRKSNTNINPEIMRQTLENWDGNLVLYLGYLDFLRPCFLVACMNVWSFIFIT